MLKYSNSSLRSSLHSLAGCVAFKGEMEHMGQQITAGIRYIIAVFLYAEDFT